MGGGCGGGYLRIGIFCFSRNYSNIWLWKLPRAVWSSHPAITTSPLNYRHTQLGVLAIASHRNHRSRTLLGVLEKLYHHREQRQDLDYENEVQGCFVHYRNHMPLEGQEGRVRQPRHTQQLVLGFEIVGQFGSLESIRLRDGHVR